MRQTTVFLKTVLMKTALMKSVLTIGLLAALAVSAGAAPQVVQEAQEPVDLGAQDKGVWISIGNDAFQRIAKRADLSFDSLPLKASASRADAVVTRVKEGDLKNISNLLHDAYHRCPGFIVHQSYDEALEAIEQADANHSKAALVSYTIDQQALVQSLEPFVTKANILGTIDHLSNNYNNRYYTHPSGANASVWIRDLWQGYAAGRSDVTVELYSHSGYSQNSVILTIQGATTPDEVVVLGGHLDSTASGTSNPNFIAPGADDNASGIATLSEVIRILLSEGFVPDRTVKFMGYAAEEVGLRGSGDIAAAHQSAGTDVVAVLQFDMTAFNGSSQDFGLLQDYTNSDLTSFVGQLIDTYQPNLSWAGTQCGYGCSDHASWHNRGFPAVMPFEATFGQHNNQIHTTGDTISTFGGTADHPYKFARLGIAFAVEIGKTTGGGGGGGGGGGARTRAAPTCGDA